MASIKNKNILFFPLLVICLGIVFTLLLLITEIILRNFYPLNHTIGYTENTNALRYGWGYSPNDHMLTYNPDTQEKYINRANDKGWRDFRHTFSKKEGIFRVLIIGDSITYGAIVPLEKNYPQVLQKLFIENGYNVEVISIGYGSWGTDQALEALEIEGIKYSPDLIITQYCKNDLEDNAYMHNLLKKDLNFLSSFEKKLLHQKPFYYTFDSNGKLIRKINKFFTNKQQKPILKKITSLYTNSQIIKHPRRKQRGI